jgi:MFS family permease
MQSAFLIVAKGYSEKQVGVLFFVFGMSQFLFQAPAGYLLDYTEQKVLWLSSAGILTTLMTICTAVFASHDNFWLMVFIKFLQGGITSFIPPGLNSITQGIVGAVGMTEQVSINEMMNHLGTAIIVFTGSLIAFTLYPTIGFLFIVSPIACVGFLYFLNKIRPEDIDHNAARGLTSEVGGGNRVSTLIKEYVPPGAAPDSVKGKAIKTKPSFIFGLGDGDTVVDSDAPRPDTPLQVLRDPVLLMFILITFLFQVANGTVLPLVMQTLAIGNGREGILLSGLCICVAQVFMVMSAKICGKFSGKYGRKWLFLIGLGIVPIRCAILGGLLTIQGAGEASAFLQSCILATQILDGIGAGTFGTMYILVTSDISGGTGRFGLTLGLTTAALSIGGTVSGYMGQALAQDLGYLKAFWILMALSMLPALLYLFCMPETLPDHSDPRDISRIASIKEDQEEGESGPSTPAKDSSGNYIEMI